MPEPIKKYNQLTKKESLVEVQTDAFKILKINPKHIDKAMWKSAVNQSGMVLEVAPQNIKEDKDVVLLAVKSWPTAIVYAADIFKDDLDVALCVARRNPRRIKYFSEEIRNNPEVLEAIKNFKGSRYNTNFN